MHPFAKLQTIADVSKSSLQEYDRYLTLLYRFRAVGYDPAKLYHMSPFRVSDICTNSVLYRANRDLRWLALQLNQTEAG